MCVRVLCVGRVTGVGWGWDWVLLKHTHRYKKPEALGIMWDSMWPYSQMSVEGWLRFISHPGSSAGSMVSISKYLHYCQNKNPPCLNST